MGVPPLPPLDSAASSALGPIAATTGEHAGSTSRTRTLCSVLSQLSPGDQIADRRAAGPDVPLVGAGVVPSPPSAAGWPALRQYATRYVFGVDGSRAVCQLIGGGSRELVVSGSFACCNQVQGISATA